MGSLIELGNPQKNIKTFRDKKLVFMLPLKKQKKKSE